MPDEPSSLPDDELLARVRRGDAAAEAALFRRYYDRLAEFAKRKMNPRLQALEPPSDIAQSVMKSVLQGIPAGEFDLDRPGGLWPLLSVVALNKIRNRCRQFAGPKRDLQRRERLENRDVACDDEPVHETQELSDLVEALLALFPERRRRILEMILEGHGVGEIAKALGVSERTVYNTRQAAAEALEKLLKDEELPR